MNKYRAILVAHKWFVSSYGFETKEIETDSEELIDFARLKFQEELEQSHRNCAVKVIKILPAETSILKKATKLTLKERLLGRVLYTRELKEKTND